jgi:polyisoprenoid-binding protein YceI
MTTRYRLDPGLSRFTVQAFATGMLSFFAHSPTFNVRQFTGVLAFEDDTIKSMRIDMTITADSLELADQVKPSEREEIEGRMRREVLETATYPEIVLRAAVASAENIAPGRHRLRLAGNLALHGVTRPLQVGAELVVCDDGIRLRGETPLRLSDYRIRPVTALAGAIKLKDELKVSFDLAALPEGT